MEGGREGGGERGREVGREGGREREERGRERGREGGERGSDKVCATTNLEIPSRQLPVAHQVSDKIPPSVTRENLK